MRTGFVNNVYDSCYNSFTDLIGSSDSGGGGTTTPPFAYDANTYWWDFRKSQLNNITDTSADDTLAFACDAVGKTIYKGLEQPNKSSQPLNKNNGVDFNKSTQRKLQLINTSGICNATNGWFCAFNCKPTTVGTTLLRISGASTSTTPARAWIDIAGGSSIPQIRARIGNNDSGTLTTLGLTPTGQIPNVNTGLWTTVEVEVNISGGTAIMRAWINGTLQTLASPATPVHTSTFLATNPNLFIVGNTLGINNTDSFDGEMQQMIFQNSVPSAEIRSSISSYLIGVKP
jgi:hypothetical protein